MFVFVSVSDLYVHTILYYIKKAVLGLASTICVSVCLSRRLSCIIAVLMSLRMCVCVVDYRLTESKRQTNRAIHRHSARGFKMSLHANANHTRTET